MIIYLKRKTFANNSIGQRFGKRVANALTKLGESRAAASGAKATTNATKNAVQHAPAPKGSVLQLPGSVPAQSATSQSVSGVAGRGTAITGPDVSGKGPNMFQRWRIKRQLGANRVVTKQPKVKTPRKSIFDVSVGQVSSAAQPIENTAVSQAKPKERFWRFSRKTKGKATHMRAEDAVAQLKQNKVPNAAEGAVQTKAAPAKPVEVKTPVEAPKPASNPTANSATQAPQQPQQPTQQSVKPKDSGNRNSQPKNNPTTTKKSGGWSPAKKWAVGVGTVGLGSAAIGYNASKNDKRVQY